MVQTPISLEGFVDKGVSCSWRSEHVRIANYARKVSRQSYEEEITLI